MTLREVDALSAKLRLRVRRDDARAARICQIIAATMGGKDLPLETFMPVDIDQHDAEDAVGSAMLQLGDKAVQVRPELKEEDLAFRERMVAMVGAKN